MQVKEEFLEDIFNLKVVFLKINGKQIPYFVESVKIGNAVLIKFEDINSPEATIAIASKEVYARAEDLTPEKDRLFEAEKLEFERYSGFTIIDTEKGRVGVIKEVVEFPQQEMALVDYKKKEILIPLNHELIDSINEAEKEMILNLPEGLLDL